MKFCKNGFGALGIVLSVGIAACGGKDGGGATSASAQSPGGAPPKATTAATTGGASATTSHATTARPSGHAPAGERPAPKNEARSALGGGKGAAPSKPAVAATASATAAEGTGEAHAPPAGHWVAIPNTTGEVMLPADWKSGDNGNWLVAGGPSETAGFLASTYQKGSDPTELIGNAAQAANFSNCAWQGQTSIELGDAGMDANVADGVCLDANGTWNYVMYALVSGTDINVFLIGGWDQNASEADTALVAGIFRSLRKQGG